MSKKLTANAVKTMRAEPKRREIPDGAITGLYLCVQKSGAKSFVMRYRYGGRPRKLTIGPADMGLGKARKIAAEARAEIARGADPAGAKQAAKAAAREDLTMLSAVADRFIKKHVVKMRPASRREAERLLRVEIIPKLGKRLFSDVKRADVRKLVEDIAERAPIVANRTLSLFRLFCNWAREQDIIESSPCDGLKPPAPERTRERILSDDEIRLFWRACDTISWPFGPLAQLLLLTGARRDEVGAMTWKEVDFGIGYVAAFRRAREEWQGACHSTLAAGNARAEKPAADRRWQGPRLLHGRRDACERLLTGQNAARRGNGEADAGNRSGCR